MLVQNIKMMLWILQHWNKEDQVKTWQTIIFEQIHTQTCNEYYSSIQVPFILIKMSAISASYNPPPTHPQVSTLTAKKQTKNKKTIPEIQLHYKLCVVITKEIKCRLTWRAYCISFSPYIIHAKSHKRLIIYRISKNTKDRFLISTLKH